MLQRRRPTRKKLAVTCARSAAADYRCQKFLIKRGTSALLTHALARAARRSYLSAISYLAALAAGSSIFSASRRASSARKCQCIGSVSNSSTGSPLLTLRHPPLDLETLGGLARAAGFRFSRFPKHRSRHVPRDQERRPS